MTQVDKLLARMRASPDAGFRVDDVERICRHYGIACVTPRRGSHFKVSHPTVVEILSIPARRPIKPVYIRALVSFIDDVIRLSA